jgi:hypothetical protein
MSGKGTLKPCSQISPFLNVSTEAEYRDVRPIREIIKVYFNMTREGKTKNGRLTALGACGRALEYKYETYH